jgi:hypothetical protein
LTKSIDTLVKDIQRVLDEGATVSAEEAQAFGDSLARLMVERLSEPRSSERYLRLSNLGQKCSRRLWLEVHYPEAVEKLSPSVRLKFLYGDLIEALLLFLARLAGHTVVGQQDEVDLHGVKGHRDAVIDGMIVDVKSASSRSFEKFRYGLRDEDDGFGYNRQLGGYLEAGQTDVQVLDKDRAAFLVADKTLGHITLDIHKKDNTDYARLVEEKRGALAAPVLPSRGYDDVPDGASGNRRLGIECSYCPVRKRCWPGLRTFAYSNGLRHLTVVKREPNVPEI